MHRSGCPLTSTTYTVQAVQAKHCTRTKCKHSRTLHAPLTLSMPNTVLRTLIYTTCTLQAVHANHCTGTTTRFTYTTCTVQGCPCQTLYKYKYSHTLRAPFRLSMLKLYRYNYSVHVRARGLTYKTCTGQPYVVLVPHRSHPIGTPHRLHTIGAPLRWHTLSTVQASTRTRTSAQQVVGPCMSNAVQARIHLLGLHMPTAVHAYIHAHTYKRVPLGLHVPSAVPYAHPRKMRLKRSSINSDRAAPHIKHTAIRRTRRTPHRTHTHVKCGTQVPLLT